MFERLKSWREIFDNTELEQLYRKFMNNGLTKFWVFSLYCVEFRTSVPRLNIWGQRWECRDRKWQCSEERMTKLCKNVLQRQTNS